MRALRSTSLALTVAAAALIGGCVSQPEPCTPEWIEWRTDEVMGEFAYENRDTVRALRRLARDLENPNALAALRLATLAFDVEDLARDFNNIVLPELNNAIELCGEPRKFLPAFAEFLRRENVNDNVIDWVEAFGFMLEINRS